MAPNLAMKMAAMFGGGSDDEEEGVEWLDGLAWTNQFNLHPYNLAHGDFGVVTVQLLQGKRDVLPEILC